MFTVKKLKTGLRVLTAPVEGTAAVTVMVFAGAGSRYENPSERGISHFLEHMFFKGGNRYKTTQEVSAAIDGVGGEFNAFTGKEYAGYYVKVAATEVRLACDVIGDMLQNATFPQEEIEKERGVIMEEERMYQDTPMYRAGWDFEELLFGDHPLGWDTIGTEKVINSVQQKDFVKHRNELYVPNNLVATFAGKITEKEAMKLAEEFFSGLTGSHERKFEALKTYGPKKVFLRTKATEQSHLVIGVPGISALDPRKQAAKLLSIALGGNMSSRMFLRIREAKGLCYYIATETDHYLDAGALTTRAGVDQSRLHEAIADIVREYNLCAKDGIEQIELDRAKAFLKGKMLLGLEDSEELAHFFGKQELLEPTTDDLPAALAKVDAVTLADVNALAAELLKPEEFRIVVIGKEDNEAKLQELMLG
jgi:predicted Zn-dependent peptidase